LVTVIENAVKDTKRASEEYLKIQEESKNILLESQEFVG